MKLFTNKLKNHITLLCVSLVVVTSVAVLSSFGWFGSRYTQSHMQSTMSNAINVFEQYSYAKTELLKTAAEVLTADFGFKQAVATGDSATIASALENHGKRINADLMLITDRAGHMLSSNAGADGFDPGVTDNIKHLVGAQQEAFYIVIDKVLYLAVALPVKAPRTIAYAIIGFEINRAVTLELKSLTGLEVSFYVEQALVSSSLTTSIGDIENYLNSKQRTWLFWQRPHYTNVNKSIPSINVRPVNVLLSADLTPYYQSFDRLIYATVILAIIIVLISIVASILLANSMTVPLAKIVDSVNKFAKGDYKAELSDHKGTVELRTLVQAFRNMVRDIQARESHILYQAEHDLLTDLLNRNTMLNAIDAEIEKNQSFVLMAIQINGLQGVNDTLGFQIGDQCLKVIASRITSEFSAEQAVHGRLGGDLFLSLVRLDPSVNPKATLEGLLKRLQEPVIRNSLELSLRPCVGFTAFPRDGQEGNDLVRRTMIAVDNARKESVHLRSYEQGEDEAHMERLSAIEDLKAALAAQDGQLYMNYQPKMNLQTNKIEKLEALIRWQRPNHGFVPPDYFIDLAERSGLIIELTQWVLQDVIRQVAQWHAQSVELQVAINISAQDLCHPEFKDKLIQKLAAYKLHPQFITLELTERDLMSNEEQGSELMNELLREGFILSVDDYGIGQSSLGKLKQLPIQELKIDKSFILKLDESEVDQIIVQSTIELGHQLGLKVVAEGVENRSSLQILKDLKCDYMQGYYLAKPLAPDQIRNWLDEHEQTYH